MMKQQEEINLVYEKYGTSMTGGCLDVDPDADSVRTVSGYP